MHDIVYCCTSNQQIHVRQLFSSITLTLYYVYYVFVRYLL